MMSTRINCQVQHDDFDVAAVYQTLQQTPLCGAVVLFVGLVRQQFDGQLQALELEHYPQMTEKAMRQIAQEACERFDIHTLEVIHRVGVLAPQDQIVLVGAAAPHRSDAFAAAQFLMDFLKNQVPIWKKVHVLEQGAPQAQWVDIKQSDIQAAARWQFQTT